MKTLEHEFAIEVNRRRLERFQKRQQRLGYLEIGFFIVAAALLCVFFGLGMSFDDREVGQKSEQVSGGKTA